MEHWALIYIQGIFSIDTTSKKQSTLEKSEIKESTIEL